MRRRRGKDCAPALEEAEARGLQGTAQHGKATAPGGADQLGRDPFPGTGTTPAGRFSFAIGAGKHELLGGSHEIAPPSPADALRGMQALAGVARRIDMGLPMHHQELAHCLTLAAGLLVFFAARADAAGGES